MFLISENLNSGLVSPGTRKINTINLFLPLQTTTDTWIGNYRESRDPKSARRPLQTLGHGKARSQLVSSGVGASCAMQETQNALRWHVLVSKFFGINTDFTDNDITRDCSIMSIGFG